MKSEKITTALQRVLAMRTSSWFLAHMDDYFEREGEQRDDPGWFHPSSLGHPCDAFMAFQFLGLPQRQGVSARTRRIFDLGSDRDRSWKRYLHQAGLSVMNHWDGDEAKQERYIEIQQYRIRGELDDVIRHPLTGEQYVFEFKTKNHDLFSALRQPDAGHVTQVHPYMFDRGILQSMILYEDKNNQDLKSFLVPFDGGMWKVITERVERIAERLSRNQEVVRTPLQNDSSCAYYSPLPGFPGCAAFDFGAKR